MEPAWQFFNKLAVKETNVAGVYCGFSLNSGFISPAKCTKRTAG